MFKSFCPLLIAGAALLTVGGCVSTSPDRLLSVSPVDTAAPLGQPKKTGQFPTIGQVPTGETKQLTPTERSIAKSELAQGAVPGKKQAAQDSQAQYLNEVKALRKLAADRQKKLQAEIEAESVEQ